MIKHYWCGPVPAVCEISGKPFNGVMYDASVPGLGWAHICYDTFKQYSCKVGSGMGQKYRKQDDGRWLKVEG